jgi:hypothetical protein
MLVIRTAQMQVFERESLEDCVRFLTQFVREQVFEELPGISDATLDRRIRAGILRADEYGFLTYSDIAIFVSLLFDIGPTFDQYPFFQSVLKDPDLAGRDSEEDERMTVLIELATQRDWLDAYESGGQGAWLRDG